MTKIDISASLQAKSDQLNADDLIGGELIAKIRDISYDEGREDQPLWLFYEGDNNKPWKPCKSMRRVMAAVWGVDAAEYIGKSLKLYRDESVKWAGAEVGGIRISEMSGVTSAKTLAVQLSRGKKQHYLVKPITAQAEKSADKAKQREQAAEDAKNNLLVSAERIETIEEITSFLEKNSAILNRLQDKYSDKYKEIELVLQAQQDSINQQEKQ